MSLASRERASLADLFVELGPDEPTLCEGWQTSDLLVHLLVRERSALGAAGIQISALHSFTDRAAAEFAKRPWIDLVEAYRAGPPPWNPTGWGRLDELTNNGEMFIHHEDARRGQPDWTPRRLDADTNRVLTGIADSAFSRLALRKLPAGVVAELPDATVTLRKPADGQDTVTIAGEPGEVVLWVSGRDAARLEFHGNAATVDAVRGSRRGG